MAKRILRPAALKLFALFRRNRKPKTVYYHDVGTKWTAMGTPEARFRAHLRRLRPGDTVCFDDGFRGIWEARELFRENGIRPIVFVAPALAGKTGYLTWEEMKALQDGYGFDFQSHTWSHQTLAGGFIDESELPPAGRSDEWFGRELVQSKAEIGRRLGKRVTAICFPAGRFSDDVVARCRAAGYECAYGSFPGEDLDGGFVKARLLAQDLSAGELASALRGGMDVLAKRYLRMHKA